LKTRILLECGLRRPLWPSPSFLLLRRDLRAAASSSSSSSSVPWTLLGHCLPTPSACPTILLPIPVQPPHCCGHQLGAPNSRVTRDAPLAWLGRARLLGAQMMYVEHSLSLFFPRVHSCGCSLRFPRSPSTYLCTGMPSLRGDYRNDKEQREGKKGDGPGLYLPMFRLATPCFQLTIPSPYLSYSQ